MDVGAKLLQSLLLSDAEMLFLIHDDQAEPRERDGLAEQRMGSDDDVGLALTHLRPGFGSLLWRYQARELAYRQRKAGEAGAEAAKMLPGQQRRRRDHRNLLSGHGDHEGGAQGHLGLAKTHVAANQAIHRSASREIDHDLFDSLGLILSLGV